MNTFITIILTILLFGLIIFIHELGHFFMAKLNKIKVHEFAMGMGPALLKVRRGETLYTLRAFPIGGFCSMEDGTDEDSEDNDRSFNSKPLIGRISVILAGAVMNLLLGLLIMIGIVTASNDEIRTMQIEFFHPNAVSSSYGLAQNDKILKINKMSIYTTNDIYYQILENNTDGKVDLLVQRNVDGKKQKVLLEGVDFTQTSERGDYVWTDFRLVRAEKNPYTVVKEAGARSYSVARLIWVELGNLVTGKRNFNEVSGPIGVSNFVGQVVEQATTSASDSRVADAIETILMLAVLININVGLFNLLPFPALDGGRLVFLFIEGIFRKKINPKIESYVNQAGMFLLLLLMAVITFKDIYQKIF
ncbi:MAG: site-2 protease family protein [Oscillospiraceae bacterium]|nr:site-2 protease family protein [Oscillospiraceae bacterium]